MRDRSRGGRLVRGRLARERDLAGAAEPAVARSTCLPPTDLAGSGAELHATNPASAAKPTTGIKLDKRKEAIMEMKSPETEDVKQHGR